jgi:ribosomal protein S18 acetylase RimI-like enzyme
LTDTADLGVRRVTADDLAAIGRTLGNEYLYRDRLERQAAGRGILLMGYRPQDPAPLGVIHLWLDDPEEPELFSRLPDVPLLMHLRVRNNMRRQGVGSTLVREAEAELEALGRTRVALGVARRNRAAIRLYERLGYVDWGAGDLETRRTEFRARSRRTYPERCAIYVKDLERQPAGWDDAMVHPAKG